MMIPAPTSKFFNHRFREAADGFVSENLALCSICGKTIRFLNAAISGEQYLTTKLLMHINTCYQPH
jgi:hypothetical protein